jgi:hypothetical protein
MVSKPGVNMTELANDNNDRSICANCMEWSARNQATLVFGAGVLTAMAAIISYLAWCPESPRFDRRYMKRQWWRRHGF